jgi:hypothetical protein
MIIEEGFPMADLERVVSEMGHAARLAGVTVVTGDTKVVPRGAADKIFINTAGIGIIARMSMSPVPMPEGRLAVILSGTMADHGMTILTQRQGLTFESDIKSDSAPLNHMVADMLAPVATSTSCGTPPGAAWAPPSMKLPANHKWAFASMRTAFRSGPRCQRYLRTAGFRSPLRGQRRQTAGFCAGRSGRSGAGGDSAIPLRSRMPASSARPSTIIRAASS